jgi:hypothetical protein
VAVIAYGFKKTQSVTVGGLNVPVYTGFPLVINLLYCIKLISEFVTFMEFCAVTGMVLQVYPRAPATAVATLSGVTSRNKTQFHIFKNNEKFYKGIRTFNFM